MCANGAGIALRFRRDQGFYVEAVPISEQNVDVVRRALEAFSRGDVEELLSCVDPEFELHSAIVGGAEGNVYRGHEGLRRWLADSFESFEEFNNEWTELRDEGDHVLAFGRFTARGRESHVELDSPTGWVFTVGGGTLVKAEGFLSKAEALDAAGLGSTSQPPAIRSHR